MIVNIFCLTGCFIIKLFFSDKMEIFYGPTANCAIQFENGNCLRFNKDILYGRNDKLYTILNEQLNLQNGMIKIDDVDPDTFKLFLDCILNFKEYSFDNAMKIFPVAWKYKIESCVNSCIEALTPANVNENLCDTLNLAKFYNCQKLLERIKNFLSDSYDSYKLLEYEEYSNLLSAESMIELIKCVELDSLLWSALLKWADFYILTNDRPGGVENLFEELGVMKLISWNVFESYTILARFLRSAIGLHFYEDDLTRILKEKKRTMPKYSKWIKVEEGQSFTEKFTVKRRLLSTRKLNCSVNRNKVLFYNQPKIGVDNQRMLSCEITINGSDETHLNDFHIDSFKLKMDPAARSHSLVVDDRNEILRITIKWTFFYNCRVLLTSFRPVVGYFDLFKIVPNHAFLENFYFTNSLRFNHLCKEIDVS